MSKNVEVQLLLSLSSEARGGIVSHGVDLPQWIK